MTQNGITITADEGKTFVRITDGFRMGTSIQLGIDTSTGKSREDKPEYYEEVDMTEEELKAIEEEKNKYTTTKQNKDKNKE